MTGTLIPPPPPTAEVPDRLRPEAEPPRKPWWRRTWVLVVAVVVILVGAVALYGATRPSEHEKTVSEAVEDLGMSETDAEQFVGDRRVGEFFGLPTPNDWSLSATELDHVRDSYAAFRDSEMGREIAAQFEDLPPESTFTDDQIRTWTTEACEIARDSDSNIQYDSRMEAALDGEPYPLAARFLLSGGIYFACYDVLDHSGAFD